jgi:DNA replication ATP-dependent helicase Dna2
MRMNSSEIARLFFIELQKLHKAPGFDAEAKFLELNALLTKLFFVFTKEENLHFTTMFARIAFACHKYNISRALQWRVHTLRKKQRALRAGDLSIAEADYKSALKTTAFAISAFCQFPVPQELKTLLPKDDDQETQKVKLRIKERLDIIRVVCLEVDEEQEFLICQEFNTEAPDLIRVKYNEIAFNEQFNKTVEKIKTVFGGKATLNLIDVHINEDGIYLPKIMVLEPDYLIDVTSVAECFQSFGVSSLLYLNKKFHPFANSIPLMVGNIANFFLDQLMTNPRAEFKEVFPKVFNLNPLAFAIFTDPEIRKIQQQSLRHFSTLKYIVQQGLQTVGINPRSCYLEPSFYSERYGLQGRLDIWHRPEGTTKADIIELKSGKPFMPNKFGLNHNHYTQITLYDLLVRSVYKGIEVAEYILYSKIETDQLKFAPVFKTKQDEAIQLRNELVAIERQISMLDQKPLDQMGLLDRLGPRALPQAKGFLANDLEAFEKTLSDASEIERRYFIAFTSFTAREHQLAKTGIQGNDKLNGLSSLWLSNYEEKDENFEMLGGLEVEETHVMEDPPVIVLKRTAATNPLANFRQGDIAVLYPKVFPEDNVLTHQIFKGSITSIDSEQIVFKLYAQQFNDKLFHQHTLWCLEKDMMDKSYQVQYKALFAFLNIRKEKRQLLLTEQAPQQVIPEQIDFENKDLSKEQKQILRKALSAKDYFLLVGPPGTGKTKFMLAEMVRHLLKNTKQQILLLAYTNRAVDEICEAIHGFAENDYLRLGSRYACDKEFEHRMFSVVTEQVKSRKELTDIIQNHRIFVSTVASIVNRPLLLQLKRFDTAILDEASQILEPMLVGMLPAFRKFIMIGDHKQLPAVVMQDKEQSAVKDEMLLSIGLSNRRNSLFERLYRRAQDKNWYWAYDMLSHQGRMHSDISAFPSEFFYDQKLKLLADTSPAGAWQLEDLKYQLEEGASVLQQLIAQKRMVYVPTEADYDGNPKTNAEEAAKIGELIDEFRQLYEANGMELKPEDVGVITPFRAQIAQIRSVLANYGKGYEECTIDTVERYQGGARKIILISLCLNMAYQLEAVVSLSDDEQVDRKLNVALTRARQHLVLLGNERLMRMDKRYNALLDWIEQAGGRYTN